MKSRLLLCILSSLAVILVYGQSAGDYRSKQSGNWNDGANWERFDGANWVATVTFPTSTDGVVTIRTGHGLTVNVSSTANQVIVQSTATLTIDASLGINDGAGDDLVVNGTMHFNSGALYGAGTMVVIPGGIVNLATGNPKLIYIPIINNGTINWPDGTIYFKATFLLTNAGTFNITGNNSLMNDNNPGAAGSFLNSGTITKTSAGTTDFQVTAFTNTGTINLNAGTLVNKTIPFTNAGNLNFNNGAFVNDLNHEFNHNTGSVIGGTGTFTNDGKMNLNINQTFTSTLAFAVGSSSWTTGPGALTINNNFIMHGTIDGSGSLTINANITWRAGLLKRPLVIGPAYSFTFGNPSIIAEHGIGAPITNNGTMNWQDGTIRFKANVTLTNNGTFNITGNNTMINENNIIGTFANSGTIIKSSTGLSNFPDPIVTNSNNAAIRGLGTIDIGTTFNNNGTIAPGLSPGIITMNNRQPLSANSTLSIEIAGNGGAGQSTGHDQLQRAGDLALAGTLTVVETGTVPGGDYTIISLTSGSISGTFATINLPAGYTLIQTSTTVKVTKVVLASNYRSKQTGNWNLVSTWERFDGTNWIDATVVPSSTDGNITIIGTHQVTVSDSRTVDQLFVNVGATLIVTGNLLMNDGVATDLTVNGTLNHSGTLGGEGLVLVNGTMNWTDGIVSVNLTVNLSATMAISGSGVKAIVSKTVVNQGTINWTGGTLTFENGILQNNNTFTQSVDQAFNGVAGTGVFNNTTTGTFVKTTTGITNVDVAVNNSGIININSGTLSFNRSTTHSGTINTATGTMFQNNGTFIDNGVINIASGVTFNNANSNFEQNSLINFSGPATINNSAVWNVNVEQNLSLAITLNHSGRLGGTSTLTVNGQMNWTSGTVACNLTLSAVATMVMSTSNTKIIETNTIKNLGTINWTGGPLKFEGGKLQNDRIINQSADQPFEDVIGTGLFNNTAPGIFVKSGSGLTNVNVPVINAGDIRGTGTLSFNKPLANTGILSPGFPQGILTVNGMQPFTNNSILRIEIKDASGAGTGHDQLQRAGILTLAGALTVMETGTVPDGDYTIISLTSGTISGTFSSTNLPTGYTIIYNSDNVVIRKGQGSCVPSVSISVSPSNTICSGTDLTFTATPTNGGSTPSYQWMVNGNNVATNSNTYSPTALATGDQVSVVMTSSAACANPATATSNTIPMTVYLSLPPAVSISADPGWVICTGTNVTFTAFPINGGTSPNYQWKLNGNNVGINSNTYSNSNLADRDRVTVVMTTSNPCATRTTATAIEIIMTVNEPVTPSVSIAANPGNTVCSGTNVTFIATPTNGGTTPSYQWKVNGNNVATNSNTYSPTALATGDQVSVVMTSSAACANPATATSNTIPMTVYPSLPPAVSISADPGWVICAGTNVTFTAFPINGGTSPNYQWKLNGNNVGINSNTYSNSNLADRDRVTVVMTTSNPCATRTTATAIEIIMTVNEPVTPSVSIAANPGNTVCSGTNVTFIATPTNGGATPSYQWKINGNNVGSNSSTYSNNALANGDQVSVEMRSSLACADPLTATSNILTISITPGNIHATITSIGNRNTCPRTLQANPGGDVTYQWYKNSIEIAGATERRYVANSNGSYTVRVTRNGCSGMSAATDITTCQTQTRTYITSATGSEGQPMIKRDRIHLFPNPASDHVTIELQDDTNRPGEATIQLVTMDGRLLLNEKMNVVKGRILHQVKLNSDWKNGLYLVRIITDNEVYVAKLIKIN